jgi:hypothetical protein
VNSIVLTEKRGRTCHRSNLALFDHREDSANVLTNDPIGLDFVNAAVHVRPEVTLIILASSVPGITERLAGESSCENIDATAPFREVCLRDVFITFCVWIIVVQYLAAKGVYLAMEEVLPSEHTCGYFGAANAAEY